MRRPDLLDLLPEYDLFCEPKGTVFFRPVDAEAA